jgi:pentatricopeptide repeat protein
VGRLDLRFAVFGMILKLGWKVNSIIFNILVKGLCDVNRTSDAIDVVLQRMREFGCMPDVVSYNILLKGLCDSKRSHGDASHDA